MNPGGVVGSEDLNQRARAAHQRRIDLHAPDGTVHCDSSSAATLNSVTAVSKNLLHAAPDLIRYANSIHPEDSLPPEKAITQWNFRAWTQPILSVLVAGSPLQSASR
jgi:hypothetical protein